MVLVVLAQQTAQLGLLVQLAHQVAQAVLELQEEQGILEQPALTELVDTEEVAQLQEEQVEQQQACLDIIITPTQEVLSTITGDIRVPQAMQETLELTAPVMLGLVVLRGMLEHLETRETLEIPERQETLGPPGTQETLGPMVLVVLEAEADH